MADKAIICTFLSNCLKIVIKISKVGPLPGSFNKCISSIIIVEIELNQGGSAKLNFTDSGIVIDSEVTECSIPSLLEYSWSRGDEPRRPVRWELRPIDNGTELTLVLLIPEEEDVARSCAGWEAHLMMLMAAIEGVPVKFPFDRFQATREAYKGKIK